MISSVVHADTFRARSGKGAAVSPGPPVLGIFNFGDPVRLTLSSSYWPIQWTTAPTSRPAAQVSAGPSLKKLKLARCHGNELVRANPGGRNEPLIPTRFVSEVA